MRRTNCSVSAARYSRFSLDGSRRADFRIGQAIKSLIDKAMPGIQKRDTEVLQKLFLDFARRRRLRK